MSIIQWNLQSYRTQFNDLKHLLSSTKPACVCLQETLARNKLNPPSGYKIFTNTPVRTDGHERGSAILVASSIHSKEINLDTSLQAVALRVWLGKWYSICSLYLPHVPVTREEIHHLISQLPSPFLVLGDMNARHEFWGEPLNNDKGNIIHDIILSSNISLLNSESKTHFHVQTNSYSTIDLALVSSESVLDFSHQVLDDLHGSDHYPIEIKLTENINTFNYPTRFKTEIADWPKFWRLTDIGPNPETGSIDDQVEYIRACIIQAANESIPKTNPRPRKAPVVWWNTDCQEAKVERRRAERALKRNYSVANKIAYSRCKAVHRKTCNQARRQSLVNYVSSINSRTPMKQVWKRVRKIAGKYSSPSLPLLNHGSTLTDDPRITAGIFAEAFASVSSVENYPENFRRYKGMMELKTISFQTDQNHPYNDPFSYQELIYSLSTTKESSPGIDEITYSMIKKCHPRLIEMILQTFNRIFSDKVFPELWRTSIIIPIQKPNKDHHEPLNHRPIALTSCLCKLFEKMINLRLNWYLESKNLINPRQSGFRKNRSTTDSLVKFEVDINSAIKEGLHTIAVFFDLSKAYDMTWKKGVTMKLHEYGLRGELPIFIENFLSNRNIRVRVGSTLSDPVPTQEGTPQGSVLSCSLFMVAINEISAELPADVKCALYVDDLTLYVSGRKSNLIERKLQLAINKLQEWCKKTGFIFSPSKTVTMHICRKRLCPKTASQLSLYNMPLQSTESHKFLGVTLDESLSWKTHINLLKKSCTKKLDLLKFLSRKSWGADAKMLLRLYQMLIKPKLEYGYEAYSSAKSYLLDKLKPVQNEAIRISTGAFRSSPIESLHVISGSLPMEKSREIKILNYALRVLACPGNPLFDQLTRYCLTSTEQSPNTTGPYLSSFLERARSLIVKYQVPYQRLFTENFPLTAPWRIPKIPVCSSMLACSKSSDPDHLLRSKFYSHMDEHNSSYVIFTDGSKRDMRAASSAVAVDRQAFCKLPDGTTSFTAELVGISLAVTLAEQTDARSIIVATDSQSSIQALTKPYASDQTIRNIQNDILHSGKSFGLCWTPSHVGIRGNEKADALAKDALNDDSSTITLDVPRTDVKSQIKKQAKLSWSHEWRSIQNNMKLRSITDSTRLLPNAFCKNRGWERALCRLRIGHSRLTHTYLMNGSSPPECEHCGDTITVLHVMIECPAFEAKRRRYFPLQSRDLKYCLVETDSSFGGPLYKFLNETEILTRL